MGIADSSEAEGNDAQNRAHSQSVPKALMPEIPLNKLVPVSQKTYLL
jgi:hypothetical protein